MTVGPNVRKLIVWHLSGEMAKRAGGETPKPGETTARIAEQILTGQLGQGFKDSARWVAQALQRVKDAPDTQWHTDEDAAAEILRRLEARVQKQKEARA